MKTKANEMVSDRTDPGNAASTAVITVRRQTPWWVVSILAHGLIIAIAALLTLVIEIPEVESDFVPLVSTCSFTGNVSITDSVSEIVPVATTPPIDDALFDPSETTIVTDAGLLGGTIDLDVPGTPAGAFVDDLSTLKLPETTGLSEVFESVGLTELTSRETAFPWPRAGRSSSERRDGVCLANGLGASNPYATGFNDSNTRTIRYLYGYRRSTSESSSLKWLASHQDTDGHWDAVKHGAAHKNDTAVTALALLAFLGAGNSEKVGGFKENVQRGVAWLASKQSADGSIQNATDDGATHRKLGYPHAIATNALVEAAGLARIPATRAAAQKAIDYCTQTHQSDNGGWRYSAGSAGDLSVTAWYIMALKSAKIAGLKVPPSSFDAAIQFLDSVEVQSTDATGIPVSHYKYMPDDEHAQSAHRLTAIGILMRSLLGWKRDDLKSSIEWFVEKGGVPKSGAGADLYYWYYGTMCCFPQGGEVWTKWENGLVKTLSESQRRSGADAGSWDPAGEYSNEWGRVGQTALSVLCLEIWHRYMPRY